MPGYYQKTKDFLDVFKPSSLEKDLEFSVCNGE